VSVLTKSAEIGLVVDAGPSTGYGHAVRCLRLARALSSRNRVLFYPLSQPCRDFIEASGFETAGLDLTSPMRFPPVVITDLREAHGITASIHRHGARHISIHDLGLAQCHSDVAIDGSVTRLFPYLPGDRRNLFLGPQYMITRNPVLRAMTDDSVLVTFGGGSTSRFAAEIAGHLKRSGLRPVTTGGFLGSTTLSETDFARAMSTCSFAIAGSGVTLYDLLASGVPTIAVAFDRVQLRTADAFHEHGAVLSAGLIERLTPATLLRYCKEMLENRTLVRRIAAAGQMLVDGKGLSRVVEIVRRQLWLTGRVKTFTAC
jgi:spore coat polysaccharide biosynthesis predicted glycosyltransferase SpsG